MRTASIALGVALTFALIPATYAEAPSCGCETSSAGAAQDYWNELSGRHAHGCRGQRCHHCRGKQQKYEGMNRNFNCGCNGSYNYPVPPLYTYHWPGMYKQVRMTDYHSPWRFPAIRPYSDEPQFEVGSAEDTPAFLHNVSYDEEADSDSIIVRGTNSAAETSMSSKFEKLAR